MWTTANITFTIVSFCSGEHTTLQGGLMPTILGGSETTRLAGERPGSVLEWLGGASMLLLAGLCTLPLPAAQAAGLHPSFSAGVTESYPVAGPAHMGVRRG
jgi:hypothetical protein